MEPTTKHCALAETEAHYFSPPPRESNPIGSGTVTVGYFRNRSVKSVAREFVPFPVLWVGEGSTTFPLMLLKLWFSVFLQLQKTANIPRRLAEGTVLAAIET